VICDICDAVRLLADAYYHEALPKDVMERLSNHIARCTNNCQGWIDKYAFEFYQRWTMVFEDDELDSNYIEESIEDYELVEPSLS
jgi:hypothetical protein